MDEEVRPTRYGKIMRATRPAIDADRLRRSMDELGRLIAEGHPEPVASALWDVLRSGRVVSDDGEGQGARPSTTHGELQ